MQKLKKRLPGEECKRNAASFKAEAAALHFLL
jgi:hypothetical protein